MAYNDSIELGLSNEYANDVKRLILVTKHQEIPKELDEQYIVDIDLAILGHRGEKFDQYEIDVRSEYRDVPEEMWKEGRTQVLDDFLKRDYIYHTPSFKKFFEMQARKNITKSINKLNN